MIEYLNLMLNDKDFFMSNISSFLGGSLICLVVAVLLWVSLKSWKE
jgi:hypothetical protein